METNNDHYITEQDENLNNFIKISQQSIESLIRKIPYKILNILKQNSNPLSVEEIKSLLSEKNNKKLTDQAIYYHLRKLKELGFIDSFADQKVDQYDRLYNIQRYFLLSTNFHLDFGSGKQTKIRPKFLEYFNKNNYFNGLVILGVRSNDSPFIGPISFLIGMNFVFKNNFVFFDSSVVDTHHYEDTNLIIIGGPFVNNLYNLDDIRIADIIPVKFLQTKDPGLLIKKTNKKYSAKSFANTLGVIQLIENPWNKNKKILIVGGPKRLGTESAIYSIAQKPFEVDKFLFSHNFCLINAILDEKNVIIDTTLWV